MKFIITNTNNKAELIDYYPFGALRLDEKYDTFSEQRKFAGHEYDDANLAYGLMLVAVEILWMYNLIIKKFFIYSSRIFIILPANKKVT